jgi:hypothetical protein
LHLHFPLKQPWYHNLSVPPMRLAEMTPALPTHNAA